MFKVVCCRIVIWGKGTPLYVIAKHVDMSILFFCHNVFKSGNLQRRQNVFVCMKVFFFLIRNLKMTIFIENINLSSFRSRDDFKYVIICQWHISDRRIYILFQNTVTSLWNAVFNILYLSPITGKLTFSTFSLIHGDSWLIVSFLISQTKWHHYYHNILLTSILAVRSE